ncbi:uncharacterized protein PG986_004680 [Apiospora aurea]|uniref:WSC domain-containing protein n=1 Tax=Apiospora aurea TaxID=335848 RepID=A0ABR1QNA8_9PEZI
MLLFFVLAALFSRTVLAQAPGPTSFSGVPAVGSVAKDWKYLGCSTEIPGRALTGLSFSNDSMTIEACQAFCTKNNFPLSGVEYGRECYCGRFLAPPRAGSTTTTATCRARATRSKWPAAAQDGPGRQLAADDRMTIPMCTQACQGAGYAFAGLEYGRECWCGATKSGDLEDASDPMCAMQCDMPCGGDANTICGGRGAIGIFKDGSKNVKRTAKVRRHHGEDHDGDGSGKGKRDHHEQAEDDYRDFGHGPVNVDIGARKGRFVKVVRRSPDGQRQVEREEPVAL